MHLSFKRLRPKSYFVLLVILIFVGPFSFGASTASLEESLNKNPNQIGKREALGNAYYKQKRYEKVIEIFGPYSNEIKEESLFALADSYGKTGDNMNRIRLLEMQVERNPTRFRPHYLLGLAYRDEKKWNDAIAELRLSIERAPQHRPSYDALLEIFLNGKNNYEARTLISDMIGAFGSKKEFDSHLCRLYTADGFLDQALKACQSAIGKDPRNPDNHIYLAQIYYDQEKKPAAEKIFKNSARQFTNSEFVQYAAGEFYFNEKNFSAAVRYLEQAVKIKSDSFRSQLTLALSLYESRKYKEALPHFEKACRLDKTKEAVTQFRQSAQKLTNMGDRTNADQYDKAIAICSGP